MEQPTLPIKEMMNHYVIQDEKVYVQVPPTEITHLLRRVSSLPQKPMDPPKLYAYPCRGGCGTLLYTEIKGRRNTCLSCSKTSREEFLKAWRASHPLSELMDMRQRIMDELHLE